MKKTKYRLTTFICLFFIGGYAKADIVSEIRPQPSNGIFLFNWIQENGEDSEGKGFESAFEYDVTPSIILRGRYTEGDFVEVYSYTGQKFDNPFKVETLGVRFNLPTGYISEISLQTDYIKRIRDGREDVGYRITPIIRNDFTKYFSMRALFEYESIDVKNVDIRVLSAKPHELNQSISSSEAAIYFTYSFFESVDVDVKIASGVSEDAGDISIEPQLYYHFDSGLSLKAYTSPEGDIFGAGVNYYFH